VARETTSRTIRKIINYSSSRSTFAAQGAARGSDWRLRPSLPPVPRFRPEAIKHSAGMSRVLCRTRASPTLWTLLLHRGLLTVDNQAIAFSLALLADNSMA
jgi:hypothetical protein